MLPAGLSLFILLCFPGTALAGEFAFGPTEGITYRFSTTDPDVHELNEEQIGKFERNRERALHDALWFLHGARWVMGGFFWVERGVDFLGRASGVLIQPPPPEEALADLVTRKIEEMARTLDAFLVKHAPFVAEMNQWGLQFSVGGMYGLAGYRFGTGKGVWLTLHVAWNRESRARTMKVTVDRESLEYAIPAIVSAGVAVKVVYVLGFESEESDEGHTFYPMMLPLSQVTRRTLGIGYSRGVFFPPAFYVVHVQNKLRRSAPLSIRKPFQRGKNWVRGCWSRLLSLAKKP